MPTYKIHTQKNSLPRFFAQRLKGLKAIVQNGGRGLGWRDRSSQGLALMSGSIPGFHKVRPPSPPPPFCPDARFVLLTGEGGQAPASSRWIKYLAGLPHALPPGPNHHINTCRDRFSMMRLIFALWQVQSALWRIASKSRSLLLDRFLISTIDLWHDEHLLGDLIGCRASFVGCAVCVFVPVGSVCVNCGAGQGSIPPCRE